MAALVPTRSRRPRHHHRRPPARRQLRRPGRLLLHAPARLRPEGRPSRLPHLQPAPRRAPSTQEIKRRGAIMVEQARALKQATNKPTKVQYTGVQVLAQCTNDLYYDDSRDRAMALAAAMNEDILEVDSMGVDFIQLDEFTWPYFYEDWAIEAFNRAVQGVQHAQVIVHVCWGNWGGTPAYQPDGTAEAGEIFDLTERRGEAPSATASVVPKSYEARSTCSTSRAAGRRVDDLSGLDVIKNNPLPEHVSFWAGVIDVKSTITETAERGGRPDRPAARVRPRRTAGRDDGLRPHPPAALHRGRQAPRARRRHGDGARQAGRLSVGPGAECHARAAGDMPRLRARVPVAGHGRRPGPALLGVLGLWRPGRAGRRDPGGGIPSRSPGATPACGCGCGSTPSRGDQALPR